MSIITSPLLLGADSGIYQISRSLRFSPGDSSFLRRTPASAGNRKTWTFSCWIKRADSGSRMDFLSTNIATSGNYLSFQFSSNNALALGYDNGEIFKTSAVYRDFSAWMHVVLALDTTLATAADRVKLYVNGSRVTTFSTDNISSVLTQNSDQGINAVQSHSIGRNDNGANVYFDGYLADVYLLDGTATTPSTFAETDAITGQWVPKTPTGISYGTNGFKLNFSDNSTTAALGTDTSSNGNTWTTNNFSVTAGSGNDSLVDTPTSYGTDTGVGGSVRGNYAVLNPLNYTGTVTLSNGNLDATGSNANASSTIAPNAGKWYAEFVYSAIGSAVGFVGISNRLGADAFSGATQTWQLNYTNTGKLENAGSQSTVSTFTTGDVVGVAFDCSNGQATFYKNGSSVGTITGSAFIGVPVVFGAGAGGSSGTNTFVANFGQRAFAYTAPSGFKALVDTNLPTPVVAKPNEVMDVVLYTGTGAALTPTSSLGFNPDWIWIKSQSAATDHALYDVVRGAQARLESNTTDAEVTTDGGVTAFNSAGFTLGTLAQVNTSSATYAAWCWDAGTSTVTNNSGSISSTVRANPSAGVSVVTWTAASGNPSTLGHGLNAIPTFVITKSRTGADNWAIYHKSLGSFDYLLRFNTSSFLTSSGYWGTTNQWTSSTFCVYPTANVGDNNTGNMVAYCFAPVSGYSSFGSYTGNGSADGPFVYTGFRPRWVMVKCVDSAQNWFMLDTARNTYNAVNSYLMANSSSAEDANNSTVNTDFTSNGFKVRATTSNLNNSSQNYVFAAFAESPFQYARAR